MIGRGLRSSYYANQKLRDLRVAQFFYKTNKLQTMNTVRNFLYNLQQHSLGQKLIRRDTQFDQRFFL